MLYIFHGADFMEIVSLVLMESLRNNGIECVLSRDVDNNRDKTWVLNISLFERMNWPPKYIVYQTEPSFMIGEHYKNLIAGATQVWEYYLGNMNMTGNININTIYIPFRYNKCVEKWYHLEENIEKDIDVLFIGHITSYRKEIIDELIKQNINVVIGGGFRYDRERFIKRSKINLILNRMSDFAEYPQDVSRYFILGPKKEFMLCYKNKDCCLKKVIQTDTFDELICEIKFYLSNDNERENNILEVYNECISMKMDDVIKENLSEMLI